MDGWMDGWSDGACILGKRTGAMMLDVAVPSQALSGSSISSLILVGPGSVSEIPTQPIRNIVDDIFPCRSLLVKLPTGRA